MNIKVSSSIIGATISAFTTMVDAEPQTTKPSDEDVAMIANLLSSTRIPITINVLNQIADNAGEIKGFSVEEIMTSTSDDGTDISSLVAVSTNSSSACNQTCNISCFKNCDTSCYSACNCNCDCDCNCNSGCNCYSSCNYFCLAGDK